MSATMSGFGPYLYRSNDPEQLRAELATLTAERNAARAEVSRLRKTIDEAVWNDPTTKDDLRAELAAAKAEVERLRGIIRGTEWVLSADEYDPSKETIVVQYECAICHFVYLDSPGEHAEYCPFYQWEGGAK